MPKRSNHLGEYTIDSDTAIFNARHRVWKPFLEMTLNDVQQSLKIIEAAFLFSREAISTLPRA